MIAGSMQGKGVRETVLDPKARVLLIDFILRHCFLFSHESGLSSMPGQC